MVEFVATVLGRMRVSYSRRASVVVSLLLAVIPLCPTRAAAPAAPYPLVGRPSPELLQHLVGGGSSNFRLSEHRGEVVLLGFWTSWCGACESYLKRLGTLEATYRSAGLVVAGVSLDDDPARAASALHAAGAKFPNGVDASKTLGRRFAVEDVPLTLLIDRDGIVRYAHGMLDGPTDAALLTEIRQLLDE
jgi:thiol-disulfide isomerase/thioredoxin